MGLCHQPGSCPSPRPESGEPKKHVGDMRFDAIPDFGNLECGEDLERCHHYARHHFPEIDPNGPQHRLGTRHYLGLLPMRDLNNAFAFEHNGMRYQRGGSGVHGAYARHLGICAPEPDAWYEAVVGEDQQRSYLPVAYIGRQGYRPYTGVTWIFPPTPGEPVRERSDTLNSPLPLRSTFLTQIVPYFKPIHIFKIGSFDRQSNTI